MCGACCLKEGKDGGACEHLAEPDEKGRRLCLIYKDPKRPVKCGLFPEMPPILFKECGYKFIDLWENNRVVEQGKT